MNYILYYSHNSLPESLEEYFQHRLVESANGIPICSVMKRHRFEYAKNFADISLLCNSGKCKNSNWTSILEQFRMGLEAIPNKAVVFFAEHDVLYPPGYFQQTIENERTIYKNTELYFCNENGFFGPHGTLIHSQTYAHISLLDYCIKEDIENIKRFKNDKGGYYKNRLYKFNTPSVDIRWGGNYTGPRKPSGKFKYQDNLQYWGDHSKLWNEIKQCLQ